MMGFVSLNPSYLPSIDCGLNITSTRPQLIAADNESIAWHLQQTLHLLQ